MSTYGITYNEFMTSYKSTIDHEYLNYIKGDGFEIYMGTGCDEAELAELYKLIAYNLYLDHGGILWTIMKLPCIASYWN